MLFGQIAVNPKRLNEINQLALDLYSTQLDVMSVTQINSTGVIKEIKKMIESFRTLIGSRSTDLRLPVGVCLQRLSVIS